MTGTHAFIIDAKIKSLLHKMPPRPVIDVLIQHFFSEASWIYEMIRPTTFTERYNDWWTRTCQPAGDVEFAALLLRCSVCVPTPPNFFHPKIT